LASTFQYVDAGPHWGDESFTSTQRSKASTFMPPLAWRYGAKHAWLSLYSRCCVAQSLLALLDRAGFLEEADLLSLDIG